MLTVIRLSRLLMGVRVLAAVALTCALLTSCVMVEEMTVPRGGRRLVASTVPFTQDGRVSVFLNLKDPAVPAVRMEIADLEIRGQGLWQPLTDEKLVVDAGEIGDGQMFMARTGLAAGRYDGLRFTIERGSLHRGTDDVFLALEDLQVEMTFAGSLVLSRGDSKSVFITWDVESSLRGGAILAPVMNAAALSIPLITDLAYVACPDIDTVYVVRTDKNWVCGSLGVTGRPLYLETVTSKNRLYVLAADESAIKVYELTSSQLVDVIRIPMSSEPSYMLLSPDGLWAYVLEERSRYLNRVDLISGNLDSRVRLGERPAYMLYLKEIGRLAVADLFSHKVFLLDPASLETMTTIDVGSSPQGLLLWNKKLYVAESDANVITAYDLQDRQKQERLNAFFSPRRLLLVTEGGIDNSKIYAANVMANSLSVLIAGQRNIIDEIQVQGTLGEMDYSPGHGWLYAGNPEFGGLSVVGLTSQRQTGFVDFGAAPLGLRVVKSLDQ